MPTGRDKGNLQMLTLKELEALRADRVSETVVRVLENRHSSSRREPGRV